MVFPSGAVEMDRPMRPYPLVFVVHAKLHVVIELEQVVEDGDYQAAGCWLAADPYALIVTLCPDHLLFIDLSE